MFRQLITKAVLSSQRCQRNWDLNRKIPEEDIEVLKTAITECPSKQNYIFYKPHLITHRETIDKIYHQTEDGSVSDDGERIKNVQTLANVLIVFEYSDEWKQQVLDADVRNQEAQKFLESGEIHPSVEPQRLLSIGIAAGYLNLTASMLGYQTGCCTCFNRKTVKEILNLNNAPALLMGVGFGDKTRPRREHHKKPGYIFPTHSKKMTVSEIR